MFFSVIIKNLNWEILTKILPTFKRWDGVKDEKFEYYEGSLKNLLFREGITKKQYIYRERGRGRERGGNCLKRRPWRVCRFREGGGIGRKERVVFLRGGRLIRQCTLWNPLNVKSKYSGCEFLVKYFVCNLLVRRFLKT